MRIRRIAPTVFVIVLSFWLGTVLATQQDDPSAMLPPWMRLGEDHAQLAKSVGKYDVTGQYWMGPDGPAMPWTAKAERKMILGGRYLQETMTADFMGQPFEGWLIQGYDTVAKEHFTIWMDSTSPIVATSRGKAVDGVLKMTGDGPDQMTGQPKKTKSEIREEGDKVMLTMWDVLPDGKSFKSMELTYTPAK